MTTTVADQLIEVLLQARVGRIHGLVGDSLNPIVAGPGQPALGPPAPAALTTGQAASANHLCSLGLV